MYVFIYVYIGVHIFMCVFIILKAAYPVESEAATLVG